MKVSSKKPKGWLDEEYKKIPFGFRRFLDETYASRRQARPWAIQLWNAGLGMAYRAGAAEQARADANLVERECHDPVTALKLSNSIRISARSKGRYDGGETADKRPRSGLLAGPRPRGRGPSVSE